MRKVIMAVAAGVAWLAIGAGAMVAGEPIQVFMPDGQLRRSPVRVFVTQRIDGAMKPELELLVGHALSSEQAGEHQWLAPSFVAPNQQWVELLPATGQKVTFTGTLLLFDVHPFPVPLYKAMIRVTPALRWSEGGTPQIALASRPVNLGNPLPAWLYTCLVVVAILAAIAVLARRGEPLAVCVLCADDGHLSLAKVQIAIWTIVIGALVFFFALIKLEVPAIPNSLIALMGLSLATGGLSYWPGLGGGGAPAAATPTGAAGAGAPAAARPAPPQLRDLIATVDATGARSPSVARAQMLFWTLLIALVFLFKSALDGLLWEVPWELVALMGISQAGYIAPKLAGQ